MLEKAKLLISALVAATWMPLGKTVPALTGVPAASELKFSVVAAPMAASNAARFV